MGKDPLCRCWDRRPDLLYFSRITNYIQQYTTYGWRIPIRGTNKLCDLYTGILGDDRNKLCPGFYEINTSSIHKAPHNKYIRRSSISNHRNPFIWQLNRFIPPCRVKYIAFEAWETGNIRPSWYFEKPKGRDQNGCTSLQSCPRYDILGRDVIPLLGDIPFSRHNLRVENDVLLKLVLFRQFLPVGLYLGLSPLCLLPVRFQVGRQRIEMNEDVRSASLIYWMSWWTPRRVRE